MMTLASDVLQCVLLYFDVREIALSNKFYRTLVRELNELSASHEILHLIAEKLLVRRARVCRESVYGKTIGFYKGVAIGRERQGTEHYDVVVKDSRESCVYDMTHLVSEAFIKLYPRSPLIVFDTILWELHHNKEKKRALQQLLFSLNIVRRYLTDLNVAMISPSDELKSVLKTIKNRIEIIKHVNAIQSKYNSIVVLDPYADKALTESEIMKADVFIIGLLVDDMFPRPFATYTMSLLRGLNACERRAIIYKNHVIGVPKEINKIVEILLKVRFEGRSIDAAVKEAMGVDDKIKRIIYEAVRYCSMGKVVNESVLRDLMNELKLDERYYNKVLARVRKLSCWRS